MSGEKVESLINGEEQCVLLGKKFQSHWAVQKFIHNMEVQTRQKFAISCSRTISNARRSKGVRRFIKPELVYYTITYACIHGGGKYKSRSKGIRQSSTFKMDCPFKIRLAATKDGNHLEIVEYSANHVGHGLSERVYEHLPQVRRLNKEDVREVQQFLEAGLNAKSLQSKLLLEKGKKVTLKDINNIKLKCKTEGDDLSKAVKFLEEEYGANVSLLGDTIENFKGLYFSTEEMRRSMLAFPEIVFLDGTCKLPNNGLTLMLVVVEDANGLSEIVGVCLIRDDDYETFKWFLTRFKEDNEAASHLIRCFMTDKDLLQRDVINEIFTDVPVYICNRLESLSQKIKAVVSLDDSLCVFLKHFLNWLSFYNEEINSKVAKMILKKNITKFDDDSCEKKYMDLLTPYAYSYVSRQCARSKKVTIFEDEGVYKVKAKDGAITVDTLGCECSDFTSMLLPCRHILCLRSLLNLPLYCEEICNMRWLKENYLKSCKIKLGEIENFPLSSNVSKTKILNPAEKRKLANTIASNLIDLACNSSDFEFNYKIDCLKKIEILWRQGCEVHINKIDPIDEDQILDESRGEFVCKVNEIKIAINGTDDMKITDQIATDESDKGKITNQNQVPSISTFIMPRENKKKSKPRSSDSLNLWSELAVIHQKKKRKINTPTVFASKEDEVKKMQILKEIVSECDLVARCLKVECKITSLDIKEVEELSDCLLNRAMDLQLVKNYFEPIAFMFVRQKVETLKENNIRHCDACKDKLDKLKSICCASCLKWCHFQCAGLSEDPVTNTWFCSTCNQL